MIKLKRYINKDEEIESDLHLPAPFYLHLKKLDIEKRYNKV